MSEDKVPDTASAQPQAESSEPQSYEEWREQFLAEFAAEKGMTKDQALDHLANRPYPTKIKMAGMLVALVVLVAIAQSPRYFSAAVDYERAKILEADRRYEQACELLDRARKKCGDSTTLDFEQGKICFMTGDFDGADQLLGNLEVSKKRMAELEAIKSQIEAAAPFLKKIAASVDADDPLAGMPHAEKALEIWPSSRYLNIGLAIAYARLYFDTLDESYAAKCRKQMTVANRMFPKAMAKEAEEMGDLSKYRPARKYFGEGQSLLNARRYDEAITAFARAIDELPRYAKAYAYLAVAYARKYEATGDAKYKALCIKEYKTAVKLNPKRASIKAELGALAKEVDR